MEYLEGRDLRRELEARGLLPIAEAVTWLTQACSAIAEAHALGIVHSDLYP
jgi:serine/threonine-protein kinase